MTFMSKQVSKTDKRKIISTKQSVDYSFVFQECKLHAILVERDDGNTLYYFEPQEKQPKVNSEILESALKALLKINSAGFDIIKVCFYGLKQQEEYLSLANKVFKDFWNELYNLVVADEIFGRENSLDTKSEIYNFFEEGK